MAPSARGGLGPGTRRALGAAPGLVAQPRLLQGAQQRRASFGGIYCFFFPFQVKGAPRKLEAGPFLTEEERRLAQDEYVEDSSDEEVGPPPQSFLSCWWWF